MEQETYTSCFIIGGIDRSNCPATAATEIIGMDRSWTEIADLATARMD